MVAIAPGIVEPALRASTDPLAADLLVRLARRHDRPARAVATRPYARELALEIYQRKAAKGDRPNVRTEGYPRLLAALAATLEPEIIVHGLAYVDTVYLVFTDAVRRRCIGMLRKRMLG